MVLHEEDKEIFGRKRKPHGTKHVHVVKGIGRYFMVENTELVKLLRHAFQIVFRESNERAIFEGLNFERAACSRKIASWR